jgi:hypothetical protein
MNVRGNIGDSLQYPVKGWFKIILLGIMLIIPIVNLIGLGYYLRIIKSTCAGRNELPDFTGVGEIFIDGLKFLIVGIIYAIVPLIFYALTFAFPGPLFLIVSAISAMIITLFAYMGMANMAYHESELGAALRYGEILDKIKTIGWRKYMLWWIVLMLIIIITGFIITVVGGILLYFVLGLAVLILGYGYLVMFQARSIGLTFESGIEYIDLDEQARTSPIE